MTKKSSYQKLKDKIKILERELWFKNKEILDAHQELDKLDVPKAAAAMLGHRLFWFSQGKRESFKTYENTEGYPPEIHTKRMKALEAICTAPAPKSKFKCNVLP